MSNKIKKTIFIFLFILLLCLFISGCIPKNSVCFKKNCFNVEKVSTPEDMTKGLMYRTSLDENSGMLFIFDKEDNYAFWMKNTLIYLDIIWINSSNQISYIHYNATPCGEGDCPPIVPSADAIYVLEINAGSAEKYNLNIGDKLIIK